MFRKSVLLKPFRRAPGVINRQYNVDNTSEKKGNRSSSILLCGRRGSNRVYTCPRLALKPGTTLLCPSDTDTYY